jgi:succinate dehydrogenase/fumarate reductase flavoprotein subunit
MEISTDYLGIKGGIAGVVFALSAARTGTVALGTQKEGRGLPYDLDYPNRDNENWGRDTVVSI